MDRRRNLICPPDEGGMNANNPFLKVPSYRYIQPTFKDFSDDEVRRQAGTEALPKAPMQASNPRQTEQTPCSLQLGSDWALQTEIDEQFPPPRPLLGTILPAEESDRGSYPLPGHGNSEGAQHYTSPTSTGQHRTLQNPDSSGGESSIWGVGRNLV